MKLIGNIVTKNHLSQRSAVKMFGLCRQTIKKSVSIFKGITNYSNTEMKMILGHNSKELQKILGYIGKKEVIHANNLVRVEDNLYGYLIK